jgi:hypothetical protein
MKALLVTIVGIVVSVAASVMNLLWLVVTGAVIAGVGAWMQYRDTVAFERIINIADWEKDGADYRIDIAASDHKKSGPTATIYVGRAPHFEQASCDVHTDTDNTVILRVSNPVSGKVVIK